MIACWDDTKAIGFVSSAAPEQVTGLPVPGTVPPLPRRRRSSSRQGQPQLASRPKRYYLGRTYAPATSRTRQLKPQTRQQGRHDRHSAPPPAVGVPAPRTERALVRGGIFARAVDAGFEPFFGAGSRFGAWRKSDTSLGVPPERAGSLISYERNEQFSCCARTAWKGIRDLVSRRRRSSRSDIWRWERCSAAV